MTEIVFELPANQIGHTCCLEHKPFKIDRPILWRVLVLSMSTVQIVRYRKTLPARTLLRNSCSCPNEILYFISMFPITLNAIILSVYYLATIFDLNIGHHHELTQKTIMRSYFFYNDLMMNYTQVETRQTVHDQKLLCFVI